MLEHIKVVVQLWEQVDEGVKTADAGCSIHCSSFDREEFVEEYWKGMPIEPPRVYDRPVAGAIYASYISKELYDEVRVEPLGKRFLTLIPRVVTS
jgi:hypothetical protein